MANPLSANKIGYTNSVLLFIGVNLFEISDFFTPKQPRRQKPKCLGTYLTMACKSSCPVINLQYKIFSGAS
ncbi:unnamed protein product [Acanthoscelides obtectus]|uniref:Uncharacterized protein n=1 Tax=Acanthoscelides obtectus TaxID=200917 RepID=A0A9P0JIW5_ACAOB|nr:unnamed protein product [Acanthoscelides obtectus]CAK1672809.1 hypothetical protein AOBTE_LOCUS29100 [Acanthoscelides obtectus]